MTSSPPLIVIEAAREKRKALEVEREEIDAKLAELDGFLKSIGVPGPGRGPKEDPNSISGQIKAMVRKMIVPGAQVTTRQIYEAMVAEGAVFPATGKPPIERIGHVLWKMDEFVVEKGKGWSLKSAQAKQESSVQQEIQE